MELNNKINTEKLLKFRKILEGEALERKKTQDIQLRVKANLQKIINDANFSIYDNNSNENIKMKR